MSATITTTLADKARTLLPGILLCVAVTAASAGLGWLEARLLGRAWVETLVIAILMGTVIRSLWVPPCLLYTSPSPRDVEEARMPSSA